MSTNQSRSLGVVVADDHPLVLRGLVDLLRCDGEFEVVASCGDGVNCIKAIRELAPAIALVDLSMPGFTGIEVLAAVITQRLPTRVVLLTAIPNDRDVAAAATGGAYGVVLKEYASGVLLDCLREVAAGRKWLPRELVEGAVEREKKRNAQAEMVDGTLTRREREVMRLVAEGLTNKEIARHLDISEGTVKIHLHNVYQKVGVTNRTALAGLAKFSRGEHNGGSSPSEPPPPNRGIVG